MQLVSDVNLLRRRFNRTCEVLDIEKVQLSDVEGFRISGMLCLELV